MQCQWRQIYTYVTDYLHTGISSRCKLGNEYGKTLPLQITMQHY